MTKPKIAIVGANGKMGQLTARVVEAMPELTLVACINRHDNLDAVLKDTHPDIAIEFTSYTSVYSNSKTIIANKVFPIIGASGLDNEQIKHLSSLCKQNQLGGMIIPNFAIGMAIINKATSELAKYYADFSLIEFHHKAKKDKPSGTSRYSAAILNLPEDEIASIRSNSFVAKQQLTATNEHERIIFDHESFSRNSYTPGIKLCLEKILTLNQLVVGLENLL